ncbi:thermonuclease family protein [Pontibacter sp. JH31]|uniref:Thermonuclease family protein n=1 Tax=Pontibacter aquaedesilientis TaxID=2766980 RepID=A0ABR7XFL8_9BACT|nr:thermonuclease family protein [Pontibacter aquaedesilientis]MBD1397067.1 thermonuclease family protein [Pontibacter aquaedesilientis]
MNRTLLLYLLSFLTLTVPACKQDNKQAREEFRQRQGVLQQQPEQPAPTETATLPEAPPDNTRTTPEAADAPAIPGDKVVGVKDGDTFEVLRNGQTITVRLLGIDTPEKKQAYGQRAKQFASDLAFGKQVRLIEHNKDRYGRTVGTIILPDGRSLNEELVREGYAWHYKAYSKDKKLENLEADARRFKRGLWQDPNPVAPWDFRKQKPKPVDNSKAAIPTGATTRRVYLCDSSGSAVYHFTQTCSVLKRCKAQVLTVTEAEAIRKHNRRADKTCSPN